MKPVLTTFIHLIILTSLMAQDMDDREWHPQHAKPTGPKVELYQEKHISPPRQQRSFSSVNINITTFTAVKQDTVGIVQDSISNDNCYRAEVSMLTISKDMEGDFIGINDSTIMISSSQFKGTRSKDITSIRLELPISQIKKIRLNRKGRLQKGILIGSFSGAIAGGLLGLSFGSDEPSQYFSYSAGDKALALGLAGTVVGTIIGSVIGSTKISIPLNGTLSHKNKKHLRGYL